MGILEVVVSAGDGVTKATAAVARVDAIAAIAGESGFITVIPNERGARQWPRATKAEVISCDTSETDPYPNALIDYAQFESPAALSAAASSRSRDHANAAVEGVSWR